MLSPLRQRKAAKRPARRHASGSKWHRRTVAQWVSYGAILAVLLLVWAMAARHLAPHENTQQNRFDAIIVLGYPADADGNPTPEQLARVTEAVHEYERGVAPHLIVTGGAAHNQHVEAQVMARTAEAQGVPALAIAIEPEARDTIQNACYAARIMKARGWNSAEVVSSPSHLPRAGMIFSRLPIAWRTHASPALEPQSSVKESAATSLETLKTVRYLVWARWIERCEP